jgi:NAD(P) transhydrogenase subunit alpha
MKLAVLKERRPHERRVAATPDSVKKLVKQGIAVTVESQAGAGASFSDAAYQAAGATIAANAPEALANADVILKVQRPLLGGADGVDELAGAKQGAVLIAILAPYQSAEALAEYAKRGITAFAMELMPRITRAQVMDVLSSQSNLAGYRAVIDATAAMGRAFPMMMTAAGTIAPARVLVLGAGVAGLQAIATARRLGAVVSAFDVRLAAKEQVESLGATFVMVEGAEDLETKAGYAKEAGEDYKRKQSEKIAETLKKQDVAITTALIPGKPAPRLITAAMVADMKPGSVIVDLAAEQGGNCEATKPGETFTTENGVTILGAFNIPSRLAEDASALYARNLAAFLGLIVSKDGQSLTLDWNDEILKGVGLTHNGQLIHPQFGGAAPAAAAPTA